MKEQDFLAKFIPAYDQGNMAVLHELRLDIFLETAQIVKNGSYTTGDGELVALPDPSGMMNGSEMYSSIDPVVLPEQPAPVIIEVKDSDSLLAGKRLLEEGYHPAVLNFANRQTAGGGVLYGAGAQEENIFRRSNLFMSLYQFHPDGISFGVPQRPERYPMDRTTGGIYSPDITVFRGSEPEGYPLLKTPYRLGIVTVAAMNRPELKNRYRIADRLVEPVKEKMRTIFRIALKHGHDAIVLGAWGCGAFKNPPQHIAKLFHQVLDEPEFCNRFKKVVFAIVDRRKLEIGQKKIGNFLPFYEEFATPANIVGNIGRQEDKSELFNRFKGMFWGLVVGDCLGSPIQFSEKDEHPYITEMEPCPAFRVPAGYWTDDSSMAFCIAESLVRLKRYDLEDIGRNFVRWFSEGFCSSKDYAFDIGGATASAMYQIARGSLCNGEEQSQGNGSIMRFAPSYIWNYGSGDDKMLHEISDLTHSSRKVRETISLMARICDEHMTGKRTGIESLYKTRDEVNNSGWAVSSLQAALWAFETTSTFEDGMIAAVNLGGDSDSIGAVFGQIAGAYYGFEAIPSRWVNAVKEYGKVNDLIEALIRLKV